MIITFLSQITVCVYTDSGMDALPWKQYSKSSSSPQSKVAKSFRNPMEFSFHLLSFCKPSCVGG